MRRPLLIAADEADGVHWRVGYNNFYRHHTLQPQRAVRDGGVRTGRGGQAAGSDERCATPGDSPTRSSPLRPVPSPRPVATARRGPARSHDGPRSRRFRLQRRRARWRLSGCSQRAEAGRCTIAHPRLASAAPAPAQAAGQCRTPCRASSRVRATAIRRFTTSSASAITCCPRASGYVERGVASWYGPGFHKDPHLDRRTLRYVRHDSGAQDPAAAGLRARHQPAERPQRRRARQRSRPIRRQSHHRFVLHGRGQARHVDATARRWSRFAADRRGSRRPHGATRRTVAPAATAPGRAPRPSHAPLCSSRPGAFAIRRTPSGCRTNCAAAVTARCSCATTNRGPQHVSSAHRSRA